MRYAASALSIVLAAVVVRAADPVPLGPELHVNAGLDGEMRFPDVAAAGAGRFVVVWEDYYDYSEVHARTFDADGMPTSGNLQISDSPGYSALYPFVDADAAGNFIVVWTDWYHGASPFLAKARRVDAAGTPQGPSFQVTGTGTELYHYNFSSDVAVAADGDFVVAWDNVDPYLGTGEPDVTAQRFDAAGGFVGPQILVTSDASRYFYHPTIAMDADEDFVVVWTENPPASGPWSAFGQRFAADGTPAGVEFTVSTDVWDHSSGPQRIAPVAMNASGEFVVAWIEYTPSRVWAQRYDAAGAPVGVPLQVAPFSSYVVDVAMEDDGDFVVVWAADHIRGRRWDAASETFGSDFQVSATGGFGPYDKATVASTTDDAFVVAWSGYVSSSLDDDVFARRFGIPKATGIAGTKLVIVDKEAVASKAKTVFVAKNDAGILKGPGGDPAALSGTFDVFYTDQPSSVGGSFVLPSPWRTNKDEVAKYVNALAPAGPGQVKVAVLKDGRVAKVRAKGLGDGPAIDLFAGPPSASGGISAVLTVVNAGLERRFCTRFATDDGSEVIHKEIAGGLGRKLVAKNGVAAACP
jgi:hypothetical protein